MGTACGGAVTKAGRTLVERAHPFTLFALTGGVALLAFILPAPAGPVLLYGAVALAAILTGVRHAVWRAALICLPLWVLLVLLHGWSPASIDFSHPAITVSLAGVRVAIAQGARLGAVATASLALFAAFDPSRFLDAVAVRGWSFHGAYLFVATLQAAPRFRLRAAGIIEAQRARGLRYSGGPLRRGRALAPMTLPLVLGMLSEVDERAMALEMRGLDAPTPRTPLTPPRDTALDRGMRWSMAVLVIAALVWRIAR